jgi:cold shock CspA family protein
MPQEAASLPIMQEIHDMEAGQYVGQVKWFGNTSKTSQNISSRAGYGFITVCRGEDRGRDIFVHYSGIRPTSTQAQAQGGSSQSQGVGHAYRTLYKGEYVQFDIASSTNGNMQAINVTGIDGGPLMCDVIPARQSRSRALH